MALAYPEGECFFNRKRLCSTEEGGYKATDPKQFYSHFMLEYIWNKEADHGSKETNFGQGKNGWKHKRSGYKVVRGNLWDTFMRNFSAASFPWRFLTFKRHIS
jgi:hypothetical protein